MDKIVFSRKNINDNIFFSDLIKKQLEEMDLSELSNNLITTVPVVSTQNPISEILGGSTTSTTVFPAIGVELKREEAENRLISNKKKALLIDQNYIDNIKNLTVSERESQGIFISESQITDLENSLAVYVASSSDYKAVKWENKIDQKVKVVAWAESLDEINFLYNALKHCLLWARGLLESKDIGKMSFIGKRDFYQINNTTLLFGAQFNIDLSNIFQIIEAPKEIVGDIKNIKSTSWDNIIKI